MIRLLLGMCVCVCVFACVLGHEKHVPTLTSPDLWIVFLLCDGHSRNANDHMNRIARIAHTTATSTCWRRGTDQQPAVVHQQLIMCP